MNSDRLAAVCDCHGEPHRHGTTTMRNYHRCRCDECRTAWAAYARAVRRRNAEGRSRYVDAEAAREHVMRLRRSGLTLRDIARRAGVTDRCLAALVQGLPARGLPPTRRLLRTTDEAIRAIPAPRYSTDASPWRRIPTIGARRRLQALACQGWTLRAISARSGIGLSVLIHALHGDTHRLSAAQRIADAYDRLWDAAPPAGNQWERAAATAARRRAHAAGWPPPLAWNDRDLDRPNAQPEGTHR